MSTKYYYKRRLPHFNSPDLIQFVTFRLGDSIPKKALVELQRNRQLLENNQVRILEKYDSLGIGQCYLRYHDVACYLLNCILMGREYFHLFAFVIMPNHVHLLLQTKHSEKSIGYLVGTWKRMSAKYINNLFVTDGPIWMREFYDHFLREDDSMSSFVDYIENNPVTASLVTEKCLWEYSSANPKWKNYLDY